MDIAVIYVWKYGCPFCREWKLWELPEFKKQPEAHYVDLIMIDKGRSRTGLTKRDYPEKYRYLHEQVSGFGTPVPAWLVVVDGKPVLMNAGLNSWKADVLPEIQRQVAKKLAAAVNNKIIADAGTHGTR